MKNIDNFYDLYVSVGDSCRPAFHLRKHDLRIEAYPLDWMTRYSLDTVIHLFETKFEDFFVETVDESTEPFRRWRKVRDTKNNIISVHHFPWAEDIEQSKIEFRDKMKKRFKRLDDNMNNAKRVVLLCYRTDSVDKLQCFLKKISSLYPHLEIKLINMRNNPEMDVNEYEKRMYVAGDGLFIEDYSFNDTFNPDVVKHGEFAGNAPIWNDVLKKYYGENRLQIMQKFKDVDNTVIYGAGGNCRYMLYRLELHNLSIKGIAVTDVINNPTSVEKYPVSVIEDYEKDSKIIISILDKEEAEKIKRMLISKGYENIFLVSDYDFWYRDYSNIFE